MSRGSRIGFGLQPYTHQLDPPKVNALVAPLGITTTGSVSTFHSLDPLLYKVTPEPSTFSTSLNFPILYARQLNTGSGTTGIANAAWQAQIAHYDYWANVAYGGYEQNQGITLSAAFQAVKSYALASLSGHVIKCGIEQNDQEWFQSTSVAGAEDTVKINALNNNLGWAVQASGYPTGAKIVQETTKWVANTSGAPYCPAYTINLVGTLTGPSQTLGAVTWSTFCAWRAIQIFENGEWLAMENGSIFSNGYQFASNPHIDFYDGDNWFMRPRNDGCWESTATVFHPTSSATDSNRIGPENQQGAANHAAVLRALHPGVLIVRNIDYFNYYQSGTTPQVLDPSNQNYCDIALAEAPIGQSFSKATYCGSFATLLQALITQEQTNSARGRPCFLMEGRGGAGFVQWGGLQSSFVQADWQSADYQIGIAALLQWYSGIQPQSGNSVFWFDSWNGGGLQQLHWWGSALAPRNLTPNAQGIYVIPYQGMTAFLYPAGANDAITPASYSGYPGGLTGAPVTLTGLSGHRLTYAGFSDSTVNTGAALSTLTLQPRSCVFTLPT